MTRHVQLVPARAGTPAAERSATAAARRAGVGVVELHDVAAFSEAAELFRTVWHTDTRPAPVTSDLLRALSHAGCYVVGAYAGNAMVGASLAFLSAGPGDLHSHITGVLPAARGRDVGAALKLHQRTWALEHGLSTVSWTFDPLLRRNAWFNLAKLGSSVVDYLVDFYGPMDDRENGGDASDRVLTVWDLRAAAPPGGRPTGTPLPSDGVVRLRADAAGEPEIFAVDGSGSVVLVQVPDDVQLLRRERPEVASAWRHAVRDTLAPLLHGGWTATTITRDGWYVLEAPS